MINLLPPAVKEDYQYAGRNVGLLRWVASGVVAVIVLGAIGTYGWLNLHQSTKTYTDQVVATQNQLQAAKLQQTNAQVQDITGSFRLVVKVLSQEVLFSKLLKQMATVLPSGANLTNLDIANVASGSGLDITADATNYTTATQVQVNLADPANQIFAKADIESITCNAKSAADPSHPCVVILRAQFAANNPFLFINQQAATP
jgi:Tfp pilus assembly protein PilN